MSSRVIYHNRKPTRFVSKATKQRELKRIVTNALGTVLLLIFACILLHVGS